MARIHGSKGQVMMDPTGGSTAVVIASLSTWDLSLKRDRVDVTAFGDTNKQWVQGLPDISGSIGGWYENTELDIFDVAAGDTPALLKLIPSSLAPTYFWSGLAFLDSQITVPATGAVAITSSFAAAGPWEREPVAVAFGERVRLMNEKAERNGERK